MAPSVTKVLGYLSYFAWHCRKYAAVPAFVDAIRSDIVAMLDAIATGVERNIYLHARSLLENLLRHCHYNANPASFVIQQSESEAGFQDQWADLFEEAPTLAYFQVIDGNNRAAIFSEVQRLYKESSRFMHGPTNPYRRRYDGIGSINLNDEQTEELRKLLHSIGEISLIVLALVHVGPYMLLSQPIRRYMMLAMQDQARELFQRVIEQIPTPWAKDQRELAFRIMLEKNLAPLHSSEGPPRDEKV